MKSVSLFLALFPCAALADALTPSAPFIPAAPPAAMAHAAYMTLSNDGDAPVDLIGVKAAGYMMAHIHQTAETDGIATMSSVDLISVAPGQSIVFERGGLHIMLMKPMAPVGEGQTVSITLDYADGTAQTIDVPVVAHDYGS